ncbi:MAG: hypothetical protein DME49_04365 [Verrucomicrobia bacterium]|nr:MAG: hypothetical protein DME49_04365 [Verrucomicrobiota bacterium]PYL39421.1 MAG: hypothetical protein DMF34_04035 [Verrucomicrobiota bacterium]
MFGCQRRWLMANTHRLLGAALHLKAHQPETVDPFQRILLTRSGGKNCAAIHSFPFAYDQTTRLT